MRKNTIDFNRVVEMYESGVFPPVIAETLGCSKALIYKLFKQNGYKVKSRKLPVNSGAVIELYESGVSENVVAKHFNISRNVVRRILTENSIHIRTQSEAETLKWSQMSQEQRVHQVKGANEAIRNKPSEFHAKLAIKQAKTKERTLSKVGFLEPEFIEEFTNKGLVCIPQKACGPYNIDIATGFTAIEIHINTCNPHSHPYYRKRIMYLLKSGWNVVYIKVGAKTNIHRAADKVCELINKFSCDQSFIRHYGVIGCNGDVIAELGFDGDNLTSVEAFD
jgi:hypothetical protein